MQTHFPALLLPLIPTTYFWYLLSSHSKKISQNFFFLLKHFFVLHQNKYHNMKNGCNELGNSYCYIHPRDVVVGVCPLCLNERLLILAASSSQGRCRSSSRFNNSSAFYKPHHQNDNYLKNHNNNNNNNNNNKNRNKPPALGFHKIFDFGSLLHRLEFRPSKPDFSADDDVHDVSTSQEDSFISIKFEDNGVASWEKNSNNNNNNNNNNVSKVSLENCNVSWKKNLGKEQANYNKETKTVIEHGKPCASSLRWRKRIGHLFRVIKWKRSNNGTVCHVSSKVEGVKVRKGWITTLTKKRSME